MAKIRLNHCSYCWNLSSVFFAESMLNAKIQASNKTGIVAPMAKEIGTMYPLSADSEEGMTTPK